MATIGNDNAKQEQDSEEQQLLPAGVEVEGGLFGGRYYGKSAEIIAWPLELLLSLIRAITEIPVTLATELPGFVLYLGAFLIAGSVAACLTGYAAGSELFGFQLSHELVDAGPVDAETLRKWADLKRQSASVHTLTQAESAVEKAPEIITAVLNCDLPAIQTIIANDKTAVFARDIYGDTALAWAAKRGCRELIDPLLAAGADSGSRAENGLRPVDWAVRYGHKDIVTKLGGPR